MNPGEDKTNQAGDNQLAEEARRRTGQMPFYESEPPIEFAPVPLKEED